jgi:hypothetical protein
MAFADDAEVHLLVCFKMALWHPLDQITSWFTSSVECEAVAYTKFAAEDTKDDFEDQFTALTTRRTAAMSEGAVLHQRFRHGWQAIVEYTYTLSTRVYWEDQVGYKIIPV